MYGDKMGWLRVMYRLLRGRDRRIWHKSGNQKNEWHNERLTINSYLPYQVIVLNTLFIVAVNLATGHYLSPGGAERRIFFWGGGGHLIFKRTKVVSVVTENPKGGSLKTLEGFRGGTNQICLKNEDKWGESRRSSKVIRGDHFSEVTFKGGIG